MLNGNEKLSSRYATNVCRRDGDVLLRTNTLEDEKTSLRWIVLPVKSLCVLSWYATNVCRRDGDVLLRTNTLEDELHTRVPLLLKKNLHQYYRHIC